MECEKNDTIKMFFRFLKERNAFTSFCVEFNSDWERRAVLAGRYESSLIKYLNKCCAHHYITDAFSWENTAKGFNHWMLMAMEWSKELSRRK